MAEEKKESTKYKFGESELDLQKYIKNIDHNVQSYLDSKKWGDEQRNEFMNAYNQYLSGLKEQLENGGDRFSTDSFGVITDSTGALHDGEDSQYYYNKQGERISADEYNNLKDRKKKDYKGFQSRREVASFFNTVGKALKNKSEQTKEKTKEKFNVLKQGFLADWQRRNSASGEKIDLTPYLNMDEFDESTGKRGRAKRAAYLQKEINDYLSKLDGDYEFEGTPYSSLDDYKLKLQTLADKLSDGWSDDDIIAANQAGIGSSFYNDFFTEEKDPSITQAQREAQKKEQDEKVRQDAWKAEVDRRYGIWQQNQGQWKIDRPYYVTVGNDYVDDQGKWDINKWRESFKKDDPYYNLISTGKGSDLVNYLNDVLKNPYSREFNRAMQYMVNNNLATQLNDGRYYIKQESDDSTQSGLIYDPTRKALYNTFLGDVTSEWDIIKRKFFQDHNPQGGASNYYKEGGQLPILQIGGWIDAAGDYEKGIKQSLESRAKANGNTTEQQAADERKIGTIYSDAEQTAANPDTSFSDIEYARIGSAVADIASTITAFVPGAGTAASAVTGLGSTFMNAYADMRDDGVSGWDAFKNFGLNLGMDIAGLIPGGGFAAKGSKILKSVGKIIPKVALALSAVGAVANGDGIIESLNKAVNNPSDMTVQDWQNMAQAFSLIGGASTVAGAAYGKKARAAKKQLAAATNSDKIAIDIMQGGQKKTVLFAGDDAAAIRTARDSNDIDAVNNILKKYEGTKDATAATATSIGLKKPTKWSRPINIGDTGKGNMAIHDIITDSNGAYIQRGSWTGDTRITRNNMPEIYGRANQTVAATEKAVKQRQQDIIDSFKESSTKRGEDIKRLEKSAKSSQSEIDSLTKQINGRKSSNIQDKINQIHTNRGTDWDVKVRNYEDLINARADAKQQLDNNLKDPTANPLTDAQKKDLKDKITDLDQRIAQEKPFIEANNDDALNKLTQNYNSLVDLEGKLKNHTLNLEKVRKYQKQINDNRSHFYENFVSQHSTPEGKISWTNPNGRANTEMTKEEFNEILKKAGILFKHGGSFENVRKFQQAGKLTNTTSNANWFDDMYKSKEMQNWLNTFNADNFEDFNNLQKSWSSNLRSSGYSKNTPKVAFSQNVYDRQGKWNNTGTNAAIERALSNGKITRPGTSGDNSEGGYKDGYFGEQEYLRHGGTKESWEGRDNELKTFQDMLAKKGLTYTLDENTGMYLMGKNNQSNQEVVNNSQTARTTKPTAPEQPSEKQRVDANYLNNVIMNNPTLRYGLPRTLYANWINKKMTNMAIENEKPFLQDPFEVRRSVQSNLDAEMQGQRAAGQMMHMASKPLTSDGSLQTASQLEAAAKAQEFINSSKATSNEAYRQSKEAAWLQEKENAKNRHDTATQNRLAMLQSHSNKNKYAMAQLAKTYENWDTFAKQLEFDARTKLAENKAYEDAYAQNDISNYVTANLETLDPELDPQAVDLYKQVRLGAIEPSELAKDPEKWKLFKQATTIASQLESEQLRNYRGIPKNRWSGVRAMLKESPYEVQIVKDGAKIAVAGIQAKTKDAERFQKYINEAMKRNEKALDRLSKSVYSYIKASIV